MRSLKGVRYCSRRVKRPISTNHPSLNTRHVMMASLSETNIERVRLEGELDLDRIAQQVQNLFKFRNFYDHMNFNAQQRLAITKAIIELIDSFGGSDLTQRRP